MVNGPRPAVTLSRKDAFALCKDLLHGFSSADFQSDLKKLLEGSRKGIKGYVPGRSELALTVQRQVLPKYGFPGTEKGVNQVFDNIFPMLGDSAIYQMMVLIEDKLGMHAETTVDKLMRFFRKESRPSAKEAVKLERRELLSICEDIMESLRAPECQEKLQNLQNLLKADDVKSRLRIALLEQSRVVGTKYNIKGMDNIFLLLDPNSDAEQVKKDLHNVLGLPEKTPVDQLMSLSLALTKHEVLSITTQLVEGFSTPDFQKELQFLSADDLAGRKKLALTVQERILPKFGIPGTPDGVEFLLSAIEPYMDDWTLLVESTVMRTMLREIESKIASEEKLPVLLDSRPQTAIIRTEKVPVVLTKEQAFRLAGDLLENYSHAEFQQELQKLICNKKNVISMRTTVQSPLHIPGRSKIVSMVMSKVLPKYDIMDQHTSMYDGEKMMHEALSPFKDDWMLQEMLWAGDVQVGKSTATILEWLLSFFRSNGQSAVQVSLTKFEVLSIAKELMEGFCDAEFQMKSQDLLCKAECAYDMPSRMALALPVHKAVLPKYGVLGSYEGVAVFLEAMLAYTDDNMLNELHSRLLGVVSPFLCDWMQLMDELELEDLIHAVDKKLDELKEATEEEDQFVHLDDPSLSFEEKQDDCFNRQISDASTTCTFDAPDTPSSLLAQPVSW
mmetsp:Transcript_161251/g.309758  ORF Transcript_161251/g.309758 Transcript_161251/m.309758 type:complete len:672 (+) Transcript_161251:78-2093(+)